MTYFQIFHGFSGKKKKKNPFMLTIQMHDNDCTKKSQTLTYNYILHFISEFHFCLHIVIFVFLAWIIIISIKIYKQIECMTNRHFELQTVLQYRPEYELQVGLYPYPEDLCLVLVLSKPRKPLSYWNESSSCELSCSGAAKERNVQGDLDSVTLLRCPDKNESSFDVFILSDNIWTDDGFSFVGSRYSEMIYTHLKLIPSKFAGGL